MRMQMYCGHCRKPVTWSIVMVKLAVKSFPMFMCDECSSHVALP